MRIGLLLLALCLADSSAGQTATRGARAAALGGAAAALANERWGESNPAAWAHAGAPSLSLHAVQLYGLDELRHAAALAVLPLAGGGAAMGVGTFGFDLYRETALTLGYARKVRPRTHRPILVGARLRWHLVRIRSYGSASVSGLSAGIVFPVEPGFSLGATAANLLVGPGPLRSELPRLASLGAAYSVGRRFLVSVEIGKDVRRPGTVRIGTEFRPVDAVALRCGMTTDPPTGAVGAGLDLGRLTADVATERHLVLGWTPSLSVHVTW